MAKFTCSRDAQWSILGFNIYIHICLPMGLIAYNLNEKQWAISLTYYIYIYIYIYIYLKEKRELYSWIRTCNSMAQFKNIRSGQWAI